MTPQDLRTILDAATPGPWIREPIYWAFRMAEKGGGGHVPDNLPEGVQYPCRNDADFIATARNLLPAFLRLWEAAEKVETMLSYDDEAQLNIGEEMHTIRSALSALRELKGNQ